MWSKNKLVISQIIILSIVFMIGFFPNIGSGLVFGMESVNNDNSVVQWTPEEPDVGDTLTITYDTSTADAVIPSSASQVYLMWGVYIRGNQLLTGKTVGAVPPSLEMWPPNSTLIPPYRFIKTPMVKDGTGTWSISFVVNDKPDYLTCYFVDEDNVKDNNDNNYYVINTKLLENRISFISPTFGEPVIKLKGEEVSCIVDAPESASNWELSLSGVGETIKPSLTTNYDSGSGQWIITFDAPTKIGLYDLYLSAVTGGSIHSDWEPNSLKIIDEYKDSYSFVVFGDPQFHRDGSAGYAYRNEKTGLGNFTEVLQEVNILNPEFIVIVGDITEWTDEVALTNFRRWCDLYLDNIPVVSVIGNHGDFEGTAIDPGMYEWGSGIGIWQNIVGPTKGIFYYGSHAFVRGDSHSRQFNDDKDNGIENYQNVLDSLDEIKNEDMKFLIMHHPLSSYGGAVNEYIQGDSERDAILTKLESIGAAAYFHGHWHTDLYDKAGNVIQLGTTEAVGDNPGYRVVTVSNNAITKFSYEEPDLSTYSAPSNPINKVSITYSGSNDGSLTTLTAIVTNELNYDLEDAHVRFKVSADESYDLVNGELENTFVISSTRYIDAKISVKSNSSTEVTVKPGSQITSEVPTTASESLTTNNSTSLLSDTSTIENENTDGFLVYILSFAVMALVLYRRKK